MKIYILGTGGIGGFLGGVLTKAGNDVTFIARGDNYKTLQEKGLKIISDRLGEFIIKPVKVIADIAKIEQPDLIIFSVKTYDTQTAVHALAKVVNHKTIILTFQNGVENDLEIKKIVKAEVYSGAAYVIVTKSAPGEIIQKGQIAKFIIPELPQIEQLFAQTGIEVISSKDIKADIWRKFCLITAFSGMTAFCQRTIGEVLKNPQTRTQYKQCIQETITVAKADGVKLPSDLLKDLMALSDTYKPESKSSLLVDLENNRPNEIETLNGTVVRLAKKHNLEVPINFKIYTAIRKSRIL